MNCKVNECNNTAFNGRGICRTHYEKFKGTTMLDEYPSQRYQERAPFHYVKKYLAICWNDYCSYPVSPVQSRRMLCTRCMSLIRIKKNACAASLTITDRFLTMFNESETVESGCRLWGYSRDVEGYGRLSFDLRQYKAHRLSLQIKIGRFLDGNEQACHSCDNPPCVNPEHLFVGSAKDNYLDMVSKGRANWQRKEVV